MLQQLGQALEAQDATALTKAPVGETGRRLGGPRPGSGV
jgi:hypothetical protein